MRFRKTVGSVSTTTHRVPSRPVVFSLGIGVGAIGGVVVGTLLGKHVIHLVGMLIGIIDRRFSNGDEERIKFELLLQ